MKDFKSLEETAYLLRSPQNALRIFLGVVAVCIAGAVFLMWAMTGDHSSYGEHLAMHELLPEVASDIFFYRNQNFSGIFIADFAISEAEFIRWAHSLKLQPKVLRDPQEISDARTFARGDTYFSNTIEHGLYVSRRQPNGGGVDLAYNRDTGRGYIDRSSR